jgi:hypothetical protein
MGRMEERFASLGRKIDRLRAKATLQGLKAQQDLDSLRNRLDAKLSEWGKQAENARLAGGQIWDDFQTGFGAALDDLEQAYHRARDHVGAADGNCEETTSGSGRIR